ncbi:MAG: hypothetical protein PHH14_03385 [Candidatus Margulisbacteria bacterium]|nr:hypothetical protein [Candidatus Margulisiibacteriota bacterium]
MRFLAVLSVLLLAASIVSAETLSTANLIPSGRYAVQGIYFQNTNSFNLGNDAKLNAYGIKGAYGINDQMEIDLQVGTGGTTGFTSITGTEYTPTSYGLTLKYAVAKESQDMPVSVILGAGIGAQSLKANRGGATLNGGLYGLGCVVSKVYAPFIPYASVQWQNAGGDTGLIYTKLDLNIGTAIAWSKQGYVFVEYTSQGIAPSAGGNYNSGQIAAAVAYIL